MAENTNEVRVLLERKVKRPDGKIEKIFGDDPREIDARAMSARGVGAKLTDEDRKTFDKIKELQKEFQQKYCPSCVNYDSIKQDFIEKGHKNDCNDCKHHWTDIIGQCWNYRERKAEVKNGQ